jgi:cell division protease FtsH
MPTKNEVRPPNPRGDRRGGSPRGVEVRPPITLLVWLLLTFVLAWVVLPTLVTQPGPPLAYSEFKEKLRAGEIAGVVVGPDQIRGTLKAPEGGREKSFVVTTVDDENLMAQLEQSGVHVVGERPSRWLPNVLTWLLPLLIVIAIWSAVFRQLGRTQTGAMAFARSRARVYAEDDVKVTFEDVAGVDEAEDELREIVDFLRNPAKYTNLGGRIPKGVLLVGPPGTGKTLLARAVAGEARVPFFSLSGAEFVEMFVGVGAARVRDLFEQAERRAPCIVFIDELDALGRVRAVSPTGSHEEREQTLNQLLAEMDGFDSRKGVIIMAATNRPEVLDPALLRPGRFDRQVLVDKPDARGREAILRLHTRHVKMSPAVDVKVVAARTAGFAGADLANVVNEAALLAARRDRTEVGMAEMEEAIERLVAGLEKKRAMSAKEREIIAHHEAGHAIVANALPGVDPVHKISIVQRGFGALGYTLQLPLEDRYLLTRPDLMNKLAVLLAGRSAEEIALGEISTGAQNDLLLATDIARSMVTELGMSESVGLMSFDGHRRPKFLDIAHPSELGPYAQRTAEQIDAEVKRILDEAHAVARRTLVKRRPALERLTRRLLEREVIEGEELRELLGGRAPAEATPLNLVM